MQPREAGNVAQADYFLKLDGIEGESTDETHKGEIQIESFSWGLSQSPGAGGGGGGSAGKVSIQDFHFVSRTGIQSPPLLVATATGEHFKKATLTVRKAGDRPVEFLKVSLEDVLVSSYQVGANDGDDALPLDQFSLNFAKIVMSVGRQNADGSVGAVVSGGWDLGKNVKI
ncbi:MAG: type VI secretion system tube protein Hcp [Acidimicrobiales bacterium]